jgi:GNAT superfamily N-acetyltransferase
MTFDRDGYHEVPPGKIATVVTFLEMTAPPAARRPVPDRPGLALRHVARPELGWYRDLQTRVGRDWLWFSRIVMPDAALRAILDDPRVEVHALIAGGRDEGILELDFRDPPDVELSFFGLTTAVVGTGAGRWLMDKAIALAWRPGVRRFWVHTCHLDHPAAVAFYLRSGFRAYKLCVEVEDDPRLTGALPRDAAPRIPLIEG